RDAATRPLAAVGGRCDAVAPTASTAMQRLDFQLDRDFVELNQLLKLAGLCDSGGGGKALVASGAVRVDGGVETRKPCKIRAGQRVEVGAARIDVVAGCRPPPRAPVRRSAAGDAVSSAFLQPGPRA